MPFTFDFDRDRVIEWSRTAAGIEKRVVEGYRPTLYVAAEERERAALHEVLEPDPRVVGLADEDWYLDLHSRTRDPVLRIDVSRIDAVRPLAHDIVSGHECGTYGPGTFRLYNVDLPPEFRYCVETDTSPVPARELTTLQLGIGEKPLADADVSTLSIDEEKLTADEETILDVVHARVERVDPDVLVVNRAGLVPLLYDRAARYGVDDFELGREPGYDRLAGANTVESYGQVGYSPSRFNLPGRVLLDTSNSFLWSHSSIAGMLDLVSRSWRPLQEIGWASIGTVLTAIQIRKALERDVLVPWNKWEPEAWKDVRTLHAADRGGFTFAPDVGLHEHVVEIDYSSLYPNIIREYNISPETVLCSCHPDRRPIPELDYNVCDRPGFLPDVLGPILDDREQLKRRIRETDDPDERADLESRSNALKWILVTCFGYQGYRNAKWGRIECHEAINAVARDILLTSKTVLEANGWEVVHGIVDSLWITPLADRKQTPVVDLCEQLTEEVGIRLDHEADYDWVAFVPKRNSNVGALTRYFGKIADDGTGADRDAYKLRGIEARQRSTPAWIADAQRAFIEELDRHRSPEAVCDLLKRKLGELRRGAVPSDQLVVTKRVSKRIEAYRQETHTVAALRRATDRGVDLQPGQSVRYVVVDDGARRQERVRLHFEACDRYDTDYYASQLVRAAESVVSPLGWDRRRIRRYVRGVEDVGLTAFE